MARKAKPIRLALAAASAAFVGPWAVGQEKPSNLELRLHPKSIVNGVPQAFRFDLINNSGGDIRLPRPAIHCFFYPDSGTISWHVSFTPNSAIYSSGSGHGCGGGAYDVSPILAREKTWVILHPRQRLTVAAGKNLLFYDDKPPGTYEFWATYSPPRINADERKVLLGAVISFPQDETATPHIRFVKSH
jgi:hypothetical protein